MVFIVDEYTEPSGTSVSVGEHNQVNRIIFKLSL